MFWHIMRNIHAWEVRFIENIATVEYTRIQTSSEYLLKKMVAFVVLLKVGFFKLFTDKVPAVHLADSSTVFIYCFLMFAYVTKYNESTVEKRLIVLFIIILS